MIDFYEAHRPPPRPAHRYCPDDVSLSPSLHAGGAAAGAQRADETICSEARGVSLQGCPSLAALVLLLIAG